MAQDIFSMISQIDSKEVVLIKNDLLFLFNNEVTARDTYFQELRRFEGAAFETIKWLCDQEARHIQVIETILSKANILVKEPETNILKFSPDQKEIMKYDISFEAEAVKNFNQAAGKTTGALNQILLTLMNEEMVHVERLKKYLFD